MSAMNPKELVQELMVRDDAAFHNERVANFFRALEAEGYFICKMAEGVHSGSCPTCGCWLYTE